MRYLGYPTEIDLLKLAVGELDGRPAWTNGNLVFAGEPPEQPNFVVDPERWESTIAKADPGGMPEIIPAVVAEVDSCWRVFFSDGRVQINYRYYLACIERFPEARFFCDPSSEKHAVRVEEHGKRVGIIHRLKLCDIPDAVKNAMVSENKRF